jgi:alpha-galactosidase
LQNSWNYFHCNINAELLKATADAFVALGLDKIGYQYVNADDCWALTRDSNGIIHPDPVAFPLGFQVS